MLSLTIQFSDIGAKGAEALARNTSLRVLDISDNNELDFKAAKALAQNTYLSSLDINSIAGFDEEEQKVLDEILGNNQRQLIKRRDEFVQSIVVLACDKANPRSQSLWNQLPKDIMLFIISLIDFRRQVLIGKTAQQIHSCVQFIFHHVDQLKASLQEAVRTKQNFKILETVTAGQSQFRFFPPPKLPSSSSVAITQSNTADVEERPYSKRKS